MHVMIGVYNALTNDLRRPLVYEIEVVVVSSNFGNICLLTNLKFKATMHFLRFGSTVVRSMRYIIKAVSPKIVETVLRYVRPT